VTASDTLMDAATIDSLIAFAEGGKPALREIDGYAAEARTEARCPELLAAIDWAIEQGGCRQAGQPAEAHPSIAQ
jgi:hypothetical protein